MYRLAPCFILLLAAATEPTGTLRVRTLPEVEVVWEGVPIGTTDAEGVLVIRDIPPGAYTVTLRKEGYRELRRRIEVEPGGDEILPLRLEKPGAEAPALAVAGEPAEPLLSHQRAFLLFLLAAAGTLLAYRMAAARPGKRRPRSRRRRARSTAGHDIDWSGPAPEFLEELSHRERNLDRFAGAAPPPEEVIDVEFTEVRTAEDDP